MDSILAIGISDLSHETLPFVVAENMVEKNRAITGKEQDYDPKKEC